MTSPRSEAQDDVASDLVSGDGGDGVLLDDQSLTGLEDSALGYSLFPGLKVDLSGSTSYIYDSNTNQTPVPNSASLFAFTLGAAVKSGKEDKRGGFYGIDYIGQAFVYTDSADDLGRDPYEHFFGGNVGVNGAKTKVRLDFDYHRNNGNAIQWDRIERETRRSASHDYNLNFGVTRDLFRGDLEFGAGYTLRDFDAGTGLNDGENTYTDIAWLTTPSFAPKSAIGLGVRTGTDNYDGQSSQDYVTPSLRWRYKVSGKTSLHHSLGYEFRSIDAPGAQDSENVVFNGGIDWAATSKTRMGLSYYRNVQPSYALNGQDSTLSGVALDVANRLPGHFLLTTRLGYENADYFSSAVGGVAGRNDDFVRLSMDLSRPLNLGGKLRGEWAIFFHHNRNDSSQAPFEFEQNITGVRFGFAY
ncbi:MAG: outer membrane beta-barrel protein [Verrucomicrobiae bacterium]|nr:outer membrane beta-barrel protein [Verrucomicrobiae bacterium]